MKVIILVAWCSALQISLSDMKADLDDHKTYIAQLLRQAQYDKSEFKEKIKSEVATIYQYCCIESEDSWSCLPLPDT